MFLLEKNFIQQSPCMKFSFFTYILTIVKYNLLCYFAGTQFQLGINSPNSRRILVACVGTAIRASRILCNDSLINYIPAR